MLAFQRIQSRVRDVCCIETTHHCAHPPAQHLQLRVAVLKLLRYEKECCQSKYCNYNKTVSTTYMSNMQNKGLCERTKQFHFSLCAANLKSDLSRLIAIENTIQLALHILIYRFQCLSISQAQYLLDTSALQRACTPGFWRMRFVNPEQALPLQRHQLRIGCGTCD